MKIKIILLQEIYLSYIGGNKTATIVRRILERVFTNSFATQCNWTGKNNKYKLKELRLTEVILGKLKHLKHKIKLLIVNILLLQIVYV